MSRNGQQLPETSINPSGGMSVPNNNYQLHPNRQEDCKQMQTTLNVSNTASSQASNLQPALTKTEATNQNNCYVVYISLPNSGQVIMPLMTDVSSGVRNLSPFSQLRDVKLHPSAVASNLPIRISSPVVPLVVSSACSTPTDGMAGQTHDKSRAPIAVVSPYNNSAHNYRSDGLQLTKEPSPNQQNFQNVSPVMICQPGSIRQLAAQPRSCPEMTVQQQSALQQSHTCSVVSSPGWHNPAIPHQGSRPLTALTTNHQLFQQQRNAMLAQQQTSSQQDLRLRFGSQQQEMLVQQLQRPQINQLVGGQQLLGQHGCSQQVLLQQNNLQQLTSQGNNFQQARPVRTNCSQVRAQQGIYQQLPSSDQRFPVPQQLPSLQVSNFSQLSQHSANQFTVQHRNLQHVAQQPENSQILMIQQLTQPQQQLHLGLVPALTSSQGISPQTLVQSGVSQQLVKQNKNSQSLALLLSNYGNLNANANMLSKGVDLQQVDSQLMELQQHILRQGSNNTSQLESKNVASQIPSEITQLLSNLKSQLPNGSCMQSDNKQERLQLHNQQLLQQQQQQHLLALSNAVRGNILMAENKSQHKGCDRENGSVNLPSQCVSILSSAAQNLKNGVIATGNEKCVDTNNTKVDVAQGKLSIDSKGSRIAPCESSSKSCFPIHSLSQQSHLFNQCLNNNVFRQNSCVTSVNHSALNNLQFSVSCSGVEAGFHSRFQGAQTHRFVVASSLPDGNNCNIGNNVIAESKVPTLDESIRFSSPQTTVGKTFCHLGSTPVGSSLSNVATFDNSRQNSAVVGSQVGEHCTGNTLSVCSAQNSASLSGNFVSQGICSPSTLVRLRMALPPGKSYENTSDTRSQVGHLEQTFLQNYSPPGAAPFPQSCLRNHVMPVNSNFASSVVDQAVSCQRLPNAFIATPGSGNMPTAQSKVELAPISATNDGKILNYGKIQSDGKVQNDGKIQELPVKNNSSATFFFSVAHSESNVSSVSSSDLTSSTHQLEKGQECELRYCSGQRLKAIWDGKYFKVKNPMCSNQDSDLFNVNPSYQPSVKGGGIILKEAQKNVTSESTSGLRTSTPGSMMVQESVGSVSETVPLTRPPLHQGTDVLPKSTGSDVTFVSSSLSSVTSAPTASSVPKKPREEGKYAVCTHCGVFSCDYDRCDQCRCTLPPDVKLYDPKRPKMDAPFRSSVVLPAPTAETARKQTRKSGDLVLGARRPAGEGDSKISPKAHHPALKAIPVSQKPSAKLLRKPEAEIVHILSSDEEDEDPLSSKISQNPQTPLATRVPHKAKKFKGESLSMDSHGQAPKMNVTRCQPANSDPDDNGRLQKCQSLTQTLEPMITANVLHAFFGFIRYETRCCLILEQKMMSFRPVDPDDGSPLTVNASEIQMVAGHINPTKCLNCLFFLVSTGKAEDMRKSVKHDATLVFNPESNEDCAKYIVLFLDEQRPEFLSNIELIVNRMTGTDSSPKPQYKRIDNFDVEKFLQTVCPKEDVQNFIRTSNKSSDALPTGSQAPGNLQRGLENEDDVDYGSRSPSPVHALFSGQIIKLFTYPPAPATGGITVTNEDLFCLNEGEFLNDVIIDFYLKYLATEFLSDKFQRTHVFSSFFYRRLTQKPSRRHKEEEDLECASSIQLRRHSRVRTWTRHVDIFEKDFLIVPINESAHWYLAIICYPGFTSPEFGYKSQKESTDETSETTSKKTKSKGKTDSPEKSENTCGGSGRKRKAKAKKAVSAKSRAEQYIKKMPCILVFDSLAGPGRNGVIRILREYLQVEWDMKKKETLGLREFTKENMKGSSPECPQQSNFSDCGVYVLQYVESFFTDPIEDFTFPLKLVGKWFNEDKVKNKRFGLQQLIIDMQNKYNPSLDYNPETDGCVVKCESEELTSSSGNSSQAAIV